MQLREWQRGISKIRAGAVFTGSSVPKVQQDRECLDVVVSSSWSGTPYFSLNLDHIALPPPRCELNPRRLEFLISGLFNAIPVLQSVLKYWHCNPVRWLFVWPGAYMQKSKFQESVVEKLKKPSTS